MATNNNTSISQRIRDLFRIQQAVDEVPTQVASSILPVVEVSPAKEIQIASATSSDDNLFTVSSAASGLRTFIVGMSLSVAKDVVATSLLSQFLITPIGKAAVAAVSIRLEPVTVAQGLQESIIFPFPIEVEPGTNFSITNTTSTASIDVTGTIFFYQEQA